MNKDLKCISSNQDLTKSKKINNKIRLDESNSLIQSKFLSLIY